MADEKKSNAKPAAASAANSAGTTPKGDVATARGPQHKPAEQNGQEDQATLAEQTQGWRMHPGEKNTRPYPQLILGELAPRLAPALGKMQTIFQNHLMPAQGGGPPEVEEYLRHLTQKQKGCASTHKLQQLEEELAQLKQAASLPFLREQLCGQLQTKEKDVKK